MYCEAVSSLGAWRRRGGAEAVVLASVCTDERMSSSDVDAARFREAAVGRDIAEGCSEGRLGRERV
jgi:hypothetical protein